jgi:hypothetical protein
MTKKQTEHGSAYLRQRAFDLECIKLGLKVRDYDHQIERMFEDDILVQGLSIRHPQDEGEDYLVTVRMIRAGEWFVAFHAAGSFHELLEGLVNRMRNKSLKWKEDKYAGQ